MRNPLFFIGLAFVGALACCDLTPAQRQEAIAENRFEASDLDTITKPPITGLEPQFATFTLNASKGATWKLPSGTEIVVPADAVADAQGKILRGSVKLLYREMHDAIALFLSGAPNLQQNNRVSTAGSFDLRCATEGARLIKPVGVKLASYTEGFNHAFYFLNEKEKRWDSIGTTRPTINTTKLKLLQSIEKERLILQFANDNDCFVFNTAAKFDFFKLNNADAEHGNRTASDSTKSTLADHLAPYGLNWVANECYTKTIIEWEGVYYPAAQFVWKNLSRLALPDWSKNLNGTFTQTGNATYLFTVKNPADSTSFSTELEAVIPLKNILAHTPQDWKNHLTQTAQTVREQSLRARQIANLHRPFEVKTFGFYNWDNPQAHGEGVSLSAAFDFPIEVNKKNAGVRIIFISGDNKTLMMMPPDDWVNFSFVPDAGGRLFSILPGNRIALFSNDKYRRLKFDNWQKQPTPQYIFEFEDKNTVKTEADLRRILTI